MITSLAAFDEREGKRESQREGGGREGGREGQTEGVCVCMTHTHTHTQRKYVCGITYIHTCVCMYVQIQATP